MHSERCEGLQDFISKGRQGEGGGGKRVREGKYKGGREGGKEKGERREGK